MARDERGHGAVAAVGRDARAARQAGQEHVHARAARCRVIGAQKMPAPGASRHSHVAASSKCTRVALQPASARHRAGVSARRRPPVGRVAVRSSDTRRRQPRRPGLGRRAGGRRGSRRGWCARERDGARPTGARDAPRAPRRRAAAPYGMRCRARPARPRTRTTSRRGGSQGTAPDRGQSRPAARSTARRRPAGDPSRRAARRGRDEREPLPRSSSGQQVPRQRHQDAVGGGVVRAEQPRGQPTINAPAGRAGGAAPVAASSSDVAAEEDPPAPDRSASRPTGTASSM